MGRGFAVLLFQAMIVTKCSFAEYELFFSFFSSFFGLVGFGGGGGEYHFSTEVIAVQEVNV